MSHHCQGCILHDNHNENFPRDWCRNADMPVLSTHQYPHRYHSARCSRLCRNIHGHPDYWYNYDHTLHSILHIHRCLKNKNKLMFLIRVRQCIVEFEVPLQDVSSVSRLYPSLHTHLYPPGSLTQEYPQGIDEHSS